MLHERSFATPCATHMWYAMLLFFLPWLSVMICFEMESIECSLVSCVNLLILQVVTVNSGELFASSQVSLGAYPLLLQLMAHSVQYN